MSVSLCGVTIENLRGFRHAELDLTRHITILVGPNNSGKTSLLRLLEWALNDADDDVLRGARDLTEAESELLIPARNTRGGARRLVLHLHIADGRRHERFRAVGGVSRVRFRVRNKRIYVNVRPPEKSESLDSEENALVLLNELRERTFYKFIPSSRDAASDRFRGTLVGALEAKLRERAVHRTRAGAPGEYRQISEALESLKAVAERLTQPLWDQMRGSVLPGLARTGSFTLDLEAEELVGWMATQIAFHLVTGDHDPKAVAPVEVGSGLQSLIDLAVLRAERGDGDVAEILAIEEPEAFLHPSAQRRLARDLFAHSESAQLVVSTHSPILVDEAKYGAVLLVRDHKIYEPRPLDDERRAQINTALLTGQGSEAIFARSLLLVEGEGDKLFFEALRRRIAPYDTTGHVDELAIVQTGSKTSFGPWIELVDGYRDTATGERPIEWLVVADGADAATDVRAALGFARVALPPELDRLLVQAGQQQARLDHEARIAATDGFNEAADQAGLRAHLLPIDLEWCALQSLSTGTLEMLAERFQLGVHDRTELLRRLGSKYGAGPSANARKDPWMRAVMAREVPWREISTDARNVLRRWFLGAFGETREVNALLRRTAAAE